MDRGTISKALQEYAETVSLHLLDSVESTNSWLLDRGDEPYSLVIAKRQPEGTSRLSRSEVFPDNGVHMSVGWTYTKKAVDASALTLSVALNLAETINPMSTSNIQVKWPNVLVDGSGRKLGWVLGAFQDHPHGCRVVMGVGINESAAAVNTNRAGHAPVGLRDLGNGVVDDDAVGNFAKSIVQTCARFEGWLPDDFGVRWVSRDWLAHRMVRVETPAGVLEGQAVGLDATGALLVSSYGETAAIRSGKVHVYSERAADCDG